MYQASFTYILLTYNLPYEAIYLYKWPSPSYIFLYVALGEKSLDPPGLALWGSYVYIWL